VSASSTASSQAGESWVRRRGLGGVGFLDGVVPGRRIVGEKGWDLGCALSRSAKFRVRTGGGAVSAILPWVGALAALGALD
jgi:hypothetical protein